MKPENLCLNESRQEKKGQKDGYMKSDKLLLISFYCTALREKTTYNDLQYDSRHSPYNLTSLPITLSTVILMFGCHGLWSQGDLGLNPALVTYWL